MFVNPLLLSINPFFESFRTSDLLGKLIFLGLFSLSILGWIVLVDKVIFLKRAQKNAFLFQKKMLDQQKNGLVAPLALDISSFTVKKEPNPFLELYILLKKQALSLLNKNLERKKNGVLYSSDIEMLTVSFLGEGAMQIKKMEKNLYILSIVISLGPFLGLLGTVWGILITFSQMQVQTGSQGILEGLSLALTTTVLGLFDAIPALIGYHYLKSFIRDFRVDMECYMNALLVSVENEYVVSPEIKPMPDDAFVPAPTYISG